MTILTDTVRSGVKVLSIRGPAIFGLTAHYEPSAHFTFSRRVRRNFDDLAREFTKWTLLLGKFGGRPVMQTDIQGIGVASRLEIGRLVLRERDQQPQLLSAFEMFKACQDRSLASGPIDRILTYVPRADENARRREILKRAFYTAFGRECAFLAIDRDQLEIGHCVAYQSLVQFLREDGLYHSAHRARIEKLQRHLQQEVGRYESLRFFVRPTAVENSIPELAVCYSGSEADPLAEAYVREYTGETSCFVPTQELEAERESYLELEDYERASRRFGGLCVLQQDVVRYLDPTQVSRLYLLLDEHGQPETGRPLRWQELFERQRHSAHISLGTRNSETALSVALYALERKRFIVVDRDEVRLTSGFEDFQQVSFYQLGEFRRRHG
jgi:hypothetical protein